MGLRAPFTMELLINGNEYYTNLTDEYLIEKCKEFFSDGCTSYAISFYNLPKDIITRLKVDKFECYVLKGFNFDFKFVHKRHSDINNAKELLGRGVDLIELICTS